MSPRSASASISCGDEAGLVVLVVGDVADDQLALARVGPQPLLAAAGVAGDDGVGRGQDVLGGAVILFQQDGGGVRVVAFEVLDVADGGAAERVDGLVGVTDHAQLGRRHAAAPSLRCPVPDQLAHQHVLRVVGVLVLVDQDVPEPPAVVLGDLREGLQHRDRLADQVVEVQRVGRPQPALVLGVDLGDDAGQLVAGLRRLGRRLLRADQLVLQVGDGVGQQPRRVPLGVEPHVLGDHHQQAARVVGVVDREVGVQPRQQRRLVAQDPHAGRVERRHPHGPWRAGPMRCDHALAHLRGGLVGERDGQHLADADVTGGQQVGDAAGQHRRLARARARHDQQRGALVQHRLALLGVEAVEELVGLGGRVSQVHAHRPTQLTAVPATLCADAARWWHTRSRAPSAGTIFLRVPASGARGLAAS